MANPRQRDSSQRFLRHWKTFLIEHVYASAIAGFYGALAQTYCRAEPRGLLTVGRA